MWCRLISFTLTENKGSEIRHLESNKLSTLKKTKNKNTICIYIIRHAQFSNRLHQSPVLIHPKRKPVNELWEKEEIAAGKREAVIDDTELAGHTVHKRP